MQHLFEMGQFIRTYAFSVQHLAFSYLRHLVYAEQLQIPL